MIICFIFFTLQLILFYQNIAINILKLQKKLLSISVVRYYNNLPQISQAIINHQSIVNIKGSVFGNLINRHILKLFYEIIYLRYIVRV